MTPETLRALRASIKHWEENAAAETPGDVATGVYECALCHLFWVSDCIRCPVFGVTGKRACCGSPYVAASNARDDWLVNTTPETEAAFRTAARAEVDFLKSLLPADAPKHLATDDRGDEG